MIDTAARAAQTAAHNVASLLLNLGAGASPQPGASFADMLREQRAPQAPASGPASAGTPPARPAAAAAPTQAPPGKTHEPAATATPGIEPAAAVAVRDDPAKAADACHVAPPPADTQTDATQAPAADECLAPNLLLDLLTTTPPAGDAGPDEASTSTEAPITGLLDPGQALALLMHERAAPRQAAEADAGEVEGDSSALLARPRLALQAERAQDLRSAGQDNDAAASALPLDQLADQRTATPLTAILRAPAQGGGASEGRAPIAFQAQLQAQAQIQALEAKTGTATVQLRQPLHAPEFAPALGARLAVLAAEGIQQAQLHLNPAEMGPVSVQITLDGQQAQIAFHAVQAETRRVLEQGLPELAAALQAQGLTLAGGGVFGQAEPRAQDHAGGGANAQNTLTARGTSGGELGEELAATALPAARARGILDLYA